MTYKTNDNTETVRKYEKGNEESRKRRATKGDLKK